jgi:hypothetical protein
MRYTRRLSFIAICVLGASARADEPRRIVFTDPADVDADFRIQGEYEGTIGKTARAGVQLVALGEGRFEGAIFSKGLPGAGWDRSKLPLRGETSDGTVRLTGTNFAGRVENGTLSGTLDGIPVEFRRIARESPTLGARPPEGAIVLFDGTSVNAWDKGKVEAGGLLAAGTRSRRKFRDYLLHVEFRTPYMPFARGQARGNSGVYLNDQYEFQILDSFGLAGEKNECGAYYSLARPAINMCLPPLAWQTFDFDFTMARFDSTGQKTEPAVVTVRLNGVVIHDQYKIPRTNSGGGQNDETQPGSIYLQGHGNPVVFRNIWIVEK